MPKFKMGDKVRVTIHCTNEPGIPNSGVGLFRKGTVGRIVNDVTGMTILYFVENKKGKKCFFSKNELELVERGKK